MNDHALFQFQTRQNMLKEPTGWPVVRSHLAKNRGGNGQANRLEFVALRWTGDSLLSTEDRSNSGLGIYGQPLRLEVV